MAYLNDYIDCCGIRELSEITTTRNAEESVADMVEDYFEGTPRPFVFFSCATYSEKGKALARFIERNELGGVVKMRTRKNENSGNMLDMWIWSVNARKLYSLALKKDWIEEGTWRR